LNGVAQSFCADFDSGFFMSRNWLTAILFALALAVQAIAPIAGNVASAQAGVSANCLAADGADHKSTPGHVHRHRDSCLLCQTFCDGVAPVETRQASLVFASFDWRPFAWTMADRTLQGPQRDYSRQARAPPSFS
jgi:hypothetical protein